MKKVFAGLVFAATALSAQTIYPIVTCVSYNASTNWLAVNFGYVNSFSDAWFVPIGGDNFITPPPGDRDQTSFFQQGVVRNAFSTNWDLSSTPTLTWTVLGNSATASNDPTMYCPSTGSASTACWDTNGNGVCDPWEDVNGDGTCNALDCIGRMGQAGPPGPQGPPGVTGAQGPAGASLQAAIQVVANATASSTATASCQATQVLLNGGGICSVPNTNSISGRMASSQPSGSAGWAVSCSTGQATAVALCAPGQ